MMIKCEASEKDDDLMVLCQVEFGACWLPWAGWLAALGWPWAGWLSWAGLGLAGCLGLALGWLAALGWLDSTRLHWTVFNSAWYKYC